MVTTNEQIKIFRGYAEYPDELGSRINEWLGEKESSIEITRVLQELHSTENKFSTVLVVTIFYRECDADLIPDTEPQV